MTFQPNIPQSGDLISVSQDDILQNFQAIDAAWNINHDDFNSATQGKHKFVEMPVQGADPGGALNEFTLFSKNNVAGNDELFYKRDNEGTSYQLSGPNPVRAAVGETFLPGGLLMQWGLKLTPVDNTVIAFNSSFADVPYSITLGGVRSDSNPNKRTIYVSNGSVISSQFAVRTDSSSFSAVYWTAIGPGPI